MKNNTLKVFVCHAWKNYEEVTKPIYDNLVRCGISLWMDKTENDKNLGLNLYIKITEAMKRIPCALIFLSSEAVQSPSVIDEIQKLMKLREKDNARIIPVLIENYNVIKEKIENEEIKTLIENLLMIEGKKREILYAGIDEKLIPSIIKSIFDNYNVQDQEAIVIYGGHRLPWSEIKDIPEKWKKYHVLDFRTSFGFDGDRSHTPTRKEWKQIMKNLDIVYRGLNNKSRILLTGYTPVGFSALVGIVWNRGRNSDLITWNSYDKEEWTIDPILDYSARSNLLKISRLIKNKDKNEINIFLGSKIQETIIEAVKDFVDGKNLIWIQTDSNFVNKNINDYTHQIVNEIKNNSEGYRVIKLYFGSPMSFIALFMWLYRPYKKTVIYDYDPKGRNKYVEVLQLQ